MVQRDGEQNARSAEGLFSLRAAVLSDAEAAELLYREAIGSGWSLSAFSAELKDPTRRYLIAEDRTSGKFAGSDQEGRAAGFVSAFVVAPDEAEILVVAVGKPYRRQGLGSLLFRQMLALLKEEGIRSVFLEVRAKNEAARALYEKTGCREIGRRKGYYENPPDDALILICRP